MPGAARSAEELSQMVDQVALDLVNDRSDALARLFAEIDSPTPVTRWEPSAPDLASRHLRFLLDYWAAKPRRGDLPESASIDALELRPALGYVMLLEPIDGGTDFLYRVYGSIIAQHSGIEMTRKRVWDVPSPLVAVYFQATYRAVLQRRQPMHAHHTAHHDIQIAEWDRVILPFVDSAGNVDRLLVGNVPSLRML